MSIASDIPSKQHLAPVTQYDVVVVGAGPYGITAAAQMIGHGLNVAIFGKPMALWRDHMPGGLFLRSHWWATNLSDPKKQYSFDRYFQETNQEKGYPVPAEIFVNYALWFQEKTIPHIDETYVSSIERSGNHFLVHLQDERVVQCNAVVMAIGLYYYANRPKEFAHMPAHLVSHSFDHNDLRPFAGKRVMVIGGGQSAVEYSALLNESGATVHLVPRRPILWLAPDRSHERSLFERIKAPDSAIAAGWSNWVLEHMPYLFYRFPQARKDTYTKGHYVVSTGAAAWLKDRVLGKVSLHEGLTVRAIAEADGGVAVTLSNGEQLHVDHVMLATGYTVDVQRLPMIHESLLNEIRAEKGIPHLTREFESSIPGFYFIGLTSLYGFGPLYRFVVGAKASGEWVAASIARKYARQGHRSVLRWFSRSRTSSPLA